jgi:hypothetical protein
MSFLINPYSLAVAGGGSSLPASDDFNRSNTTSGAGALSDGVHTWVDLAGTSGIVSNRFYTPTLASGLCLSAIDINTLAATHLVTMPVALSSLVNGGLAFRIQDANNFLLAYYFWNGDRLRFYKRLAGVFSEIQTSVHYLSVDGDQMEVVDDGSDVDIRIIRGGSTHVSLATTTTSLFTSATKCGLYTESTSARFDDYSVT